MSNVIFQEECSHEPEGVPGHWSKIPLVTTAAHSLEQEGGPLPLRAGGTHALENRLPEFRSMLLQL